MDSHQTEQSTNGRSAAGYTYPTGVYCHLALDRSESFQFSGYQNKRQQQTLFNMSAKPITRNYGCKGSEILRDEQIFVQKRVLIPSDKSERIYQNCHLCF